MASTLQTPRKAEIVYPDSDGERMADNTLQFDWIVATKQNLERIFASRPDVFVAGDLLWYPVEGEPKIRVAPDALVAFGRPKGYRGSYMQWREADTPPHVVFEVMSPCNTLSEMARKRDFYERHGVEEYYVIDPDKPDAAGFVRRGDRLVAIEAFDGWVSPRLGIRFALGDGAVRLLDPEGKLFEDFLETTARAEAERARADAERARAEALAARLRALGIDPEGT